MHEKKNLFFISFKAVEINCHNRMAKFGDYCDTQYFK